MGEGYRKVHARLRYQSIQADVERIRLLMREHGLQAPGKSRRILGPRTHDGTITTMAPDEMWGTDATATMLLDGQQATIIGIYDHCTCEFLGIHAALKADRYEAIVPLHQACRASFGGVGKAIAAGLKLRHDNGSQFISRAFQAELRFLGMDSSPSFVRAPEGTLLAKDGASAFVIQNSLRHKDINTSEGYIELGIEDIKKANSKLWGSGKLA